MKNNQDKEKISDEETKIVIGMPIQIEIDLVPANEVKLYERFQWLVTLFLTIGVGFLTAYFSGPQNKALLWSAIIFCSVSILFIYQAYCFRNKVFSGSIKKIATFDSFKNMVE